MHALATLYAMMIVALGHDFTVLISLGKKWLKAAKGLHFRTSV